MKKAMKVIGIIVLVIAALIAVLWVKNLIDANKPYVSDTYYNDFESSTLLEQKYAGIGSYSVSKTEYKSDNKNIDKISVWYPSDLKSSDREWPMIMVVNASNTRVRNYKPFFERLASWGFIVVGNEDPQCGTGETASITLDYMLNLPSDSVLNGKIDKENIGIIGYSQGGAGAINAVTRYENGNIYKTMFTGSAAFQLLSKNMGWEYDISKVTIPYFMAAGTGTSDDSGKYGEGDYQGVAPLHGVKENYDDITADVFKVMGRITGAEHGDMLVLSDGYMTAWMLYQLQEDEKAGTIFIGDDAEVLHNDGWQDVEKSK